MRIDWLCPFFEISRQHRDINIAQKCRGKVFEGVLFVFSLFSFQSVFLATKSGDIK
jgi:hypothetical protein